MNFPDFADAENYRDIGAACAQAIVSPDIPVYEGCFNDIRPIGIAVYYALPYLAASDPVMVTYVTLLLNVLLFSVMSYILARSMDLDPGFQTLRDSGLYGLAKAAFFFLSIFSVIGHLPITLSDLPGLFFFACAMAAGARILFVPPRDEGWAGARYVLMGLFIAAATLMKQNYIVFGGFLGLAVAWYDPSGRRPGRLARNYSLFLIGTLPIFIQCYWIYSHTGDFFLFDRAGLTRFAGDDKKPVIELIAHNLPFESAYLVKVAHKVSDLTHFVLKVYSGMFRIELPVYVGYAANQPPALWTPTDAEYIKMYLLVGGLMFGLAACSFFGPTGFRVMGIAALGWILFTGMRHTEYRYYIFPRLVVGFILAYWALMGVSFLDRRVPRLRLILPAILFMGLVLSSPGSWGIYVPTTLTVDIATPAEDTVQVFYKVGSRYKEKHSQARPSHGTGGIETLAFDVPRAGGSMLRIDPGAGIGISGGDVRIGRICIESASKSRCLGPEEMLGISAGVRRIEGMRVEGGELRFTVTGKDPQIRLDLPLEDFTYRGPNFRFFFPRLAASLGLLVLLSMPKIARACFPGPPLGR